MSGPGDGNANGDRSGTPAYGDTWVYEGIIGALPGLDLSPRSALAIQFLLFELAVLGLAWVYGLPDAALAGTVAVAVATIGSGALLRIANRVRGEPVPATYRHLLFGSNVEVVLAVFAFSALVTYLFAVDPRSAGTTLTGSLMGTEPPIPAVYLAMLVLWDVCYRIGAGWWAGITALYRSATYRFSGETRRQLQYADAETAAFGFVQLALVPFVLDEPVLLAGVVGHTIAVLVVTGLSVALLSARENGTDT